MEISPGGFVESGKSRIHDRYEILRKLGEGGFAQTFLAVDHQTGSQCVLKIVSWKEIPDWKFLELFEREAKVLSQLDHPAIPHFIEFLQEKIDSENKIILAQEYISGKNLSELIEAGKHFTERESLAIAIEAAKILEYLQEFSPPIIHRDIKPSNLLLSEDGELHLIDFGAVRDKVLHLQKTEAGGFTVVGTYGYMPFEQFQGQAIPASDIYSLGITLITLLSHKEPHQFEQIGSKLQFEPYVNISGGFKQVLQKMTAFRPEDRYQSATELRVDLELLRDGKLKSLRKSATSQRSKTIMGAAIASALFVLLGGWLMLRTPKPPVVTVTRPVTLFTGKGIRGRLTFDGKPIMQVSDLEPRFWFRNEELGKETSPQAIYNNGEFEVNGLSDGRYGVSIQLDTNDRNPLSYPGDLRAWKPFMVSAKSKTFLEVEMLKIIRLKKPEDNDFQLANWGRCCEEQKPSHGSSLLLEWDSLGDDVVYDYQISRVKCPYTMLASAASGTTKDTNVRLQLPANQPSEYYILDIHARKHGRQIGMLMTHGANGYGWDYRFLVR